jgi:argininosuccinate synthase
VLLLICSQLIDIFSRNSTLYNELFSEKIATFEDDEGAYDQKDAAGFIKLNALRLRLKALKSSL